MGPRSEGYMKERKGGQGQSCNCLHELVSSAGYSSKRERRGQVGKCLLENCGQNTL